MANLYTMTLKEILADNLTAFDNLQLDTPEHTAALKEMITASYWNVLGRFSTIADFKKETLQMTNLYTMTLKEVLADTPTVFDNLQLDTPEHTAALKEMIIACYWNWEICASTIADFKEQCEYRFNQYKDYYIEIINAYETKIDMLDGNKVTSTLIDLPRSATSEEHATTRTITEGGYLPDLKNDYIRTLRNVYHAFADCFRTLFLELWS